MPSRAVAPDNRKVKRDDDSLKSTQRCKTEVLSPPNIGVSSLEELQNNIAHLDEELLNGESSAAD